MNNDLFEYPLITKADLDNDADFQALLRDPDQVNDLSPRNRVKIFDLMAKYIGPKSEAVDFAIAVPATLP